MRLLRKEVWGIPIRQYLRKPSVFWWNLRWSLGYWIGGFTHAKR